MANNHGASSSCGVQTLASELMFKEISIEESEHLGLKWGRDMQLIKRASEVIKATGKGKLEDIKRLMDNVESVNISLRNSFRGATPLIAVVANGYVEIVKWICDSRPERNMNATDIDGYTALFKACWSRVCHQRMQTMLWSCY